MEATRKERGGGGFTREPRHMRVMPPACPVPPAGKLDRLGLLLYLTLLSEDDNRIVGAYG